jgi:hypothetical protein
LIDAPEPSATIAQGWTVTTALPLIVTLFGTTCVTPSPAHASLAVMLAAWVTTVPFDVPHANALEVTVTATLPLLVGSAVLAALTV